ncbi:hypothetical protein Poly51_00210 [Rubripirellula tenax]|uniref:Uncharacterized protein n=1 Tax=Rubripirellula tenax TaxID=2528015 RepID=A0A5C6FI89_9BACT|nr:hypothetical protein [Rubripirellula tenax]TWU59749.1 hypothetical protein Poly51_00210 [Rubripirellula tenax]
MSAMASSAIRLESFFRGGSRRWSKILSIVFPMELCLLMPTGHVEGERDIHQIWKLVDALERCENGPIQRGGVQVVEGGQR